MEFAADSIVVSVRHPGEFTEFVPLLQTVDGNTAGFRVNFDPPAAASTVQTDTKIGPRKVAVLQLKAKDTLVYRLQFIAPQEEALAPTPQDNRERRIGSLFYR